MMPTRPSSSWWIEATRYDVLWIASGQLYCASPTGRWRHPLRCAIFNRPTPRSLAGPSNVFLYSPWTIRNRRTVEIVTSLLVIVYDYNAVYIVEPIFLTLQWGLWTCRAITCLPLSCNASSLSPALLHSSSMLAVFCKPKSSLFNRGR